ncbi:Uncharacterized protein dnm_082780 [Desulfonema magnum]|uniref:Uncharacterized protein n=1 Tax=Desulfonema magnum TaxID=45655 RepID=A0A975GSR6_9BACT|nr:Uncharacterized protein dnm_082780 [Desulfonema magnum]
MKLETRNWEPKICHGISDLKFSGFKFQVSILNSQFSI